MLVKKNEKTVSIAKLGTFLPGGCLMITTLPPNSKQRQDVRHHLKNMHRIWFG